jgi:hypothetical protein
MQKRPHLYVDIFKMLEVVFIVIILGNFYIFVLNI